MPRMQYPPISDIASQVLREVQAERQIKTAEMQILHGTTASLAPETALGAGLRKLAQECRQQSENITFADLQEFLHHAR